MRRILVLCAAALAFCVVGARAQGFDAAPAQPSRPTVKSYDELAVPPALKAAVDARKAELAKFKLGVGRFQQFFPVEKQAATGGSGYDYAEEVLQGVQFSSLFPEAQLGFANDDDKQGWDLIAGSDWLGGDRRALALTWTGKDGAVAREEVPLPVAWDREPGDFQGRVGPRRSEIMKSAGLLLAYRAAARLLGVAQ